MAKTIVQFINIVLAALLSAAAFFIACILITRFGIKPIDDMVLSWNSSTVPADWTSLRDKWWSLHIFRTIAELAALCIVVWNGISHKNEAVVITRNTRL
jgi:hypothetical protein